MSKPTAEGDWVQAVPPLLAGLEGALHRAAVGRTVLVDGRGKFLAAEAILKQMAVDEDYTEFVVRRVFGGVGNAFRHGRADSGERAQVLFAVVALAGWVDFIMGDERDARPGEPAVSSPRRRHRARDARRAAAASGDVARLPGAGSPCRALPCRSHSS